MKVFQLRQKIRNIYLTRYQSSSLVRMTSKCVLCAPKVLRMSSLISLIVIFIFSIHILPTFAWCSTTELPFSGNTLSRASSSLLNDSCCIQHVHPSLGRAIPGILCCRVNASGQGISRVLRHSGPCPCSRRPIEASSFPTTADGKPIYRAINFATSEAYFSYVRNENEKGSHKISESQGRGVFYQYLLTLQEKFNCSITVDTVYDQSFMKYVNNSRYPEGRIGILEIHDYDMALPFTQDLSREKVAKFSSGLFHEHIRFATKVRTGHPPKSTVLWKPFQRTVWFLLILWWACFSAIRVFRFVCFQDNFRLEKLPDFLGHCALEVFRLQLFNQISVRYWKSRAFSGFTILFSFFLTTLYTTRLTALMTNPPMLNPTTFQELEEDTSSKIYINYLLNPQQKSLEARFPRMFKDHIQVASDTECADKVLEEDEAVCIETSYELGLMIRASFVKVAPLMKLMGAGRKYLFFINKQEKSNTFTRAVGVYFSMSFPLAEEFTHWTKVFYSQGVIHGWARHDFVVLREINLGRGKYAKHKPGSNLKKVPATIISFKNFFTVLILCFTLYHVTILVFVLEVTFPWLIARGQTVVYNLRVYRLRKLTLP